MFFCCIFWRKTSNHEVFSGAIPILDISMLCSAGDWIRPQTNPKAAPQPQFRGWWKRKKYRRIAERISVVEEQTLNEAKFLLAQRKEEEIQEFLCHEKISIIRWHRDKRTASLATSETHGFTALWKCRTQPYFGWRHSQSCRRYLDLAVQIHAMSVLLKPFDPSSLPLLHCNITQLIRITSLRITKKIYNLLPHIWEGLLTGFQSQIFTNTLLDTSPLSTCSIAKVTNSSSTLLGNLLLTFKRVSTKIILCLHVCMCLTYTHTCIHTYWFIYIYILMYTRTNVCTYVCIYIYIYIYMYTHII